MAKKKSEKEPIPYGVTTMWGGEDRPLHATVTRDHVYAHLKYPLKEAIKRAREMNDVEMKDQELEHIEYLEVFDKESPSDFRVLQRISKLPKYRCGQKVFVVHARVCDLFAAKGVIVGMEWDEVLRDWQYTVMYRGHVKRSFQQGKGPLHELTLVDTEDYIFPYEQKAKAKKLFVKGISDCGKWWSKFVAKLAKLKEGMLAEGDTL